MTDFFKKIFLITILSLIIGCFPKETVSAQGCKQSFHKEIPVVVIDPGHGGENQGTIENNHEEKSMTMITALAMYNELQKFENIEVYMTHFDDVDMSLKERAEYAASVNADFMYSIHYNASVDHDLFGSEIWIPYMPPYNNYAYQFGYEFLLNMQEKGIFIRGIKTKLGSKGNDYYGVIRESYNLNIPTVILEHCHVDESRDEIYCDTEDKLIEFGILDAHAVAKYFGLKSDILGIDYSDYQLQNINPDYPVESTYLDDTAADICEIELTDVDYETGDLAISVSSADYDSPLIYYDYSLDGGVTYSELYPWPGSDALNNRYDDTFTLKLHAASGTQPAIVIRSYNKFDQFRESNIIFLENPFLYGIEEESVSDSEEALEMVMESDSIIVEVPDKEDASETSMEVSILTFFKICLVVAAFLFFVFLISSLITTVKRRRR